MTPKFVKVVESDKSRERKHAERERLRGDGYWLMGCSSLCFLSDRELY